MRVLDVGCGTGTQPVGAGVQAGDFLIGLDISLGALRKARGLYPKRQFVCCPAEAMPFADSSFDRVVSSVAVPYTNIPATLAEMRRVLTEDGSVFMSMHPLRFTLNEFRIAFPHPVAILFRMYVIANGLIFHAWGKLLRFPNGRRESFQTKRAMKVALEKAGFQDIVFSRPDGRFVVEARVGRDPAGARQ